MRTIFALSTPYSKSAMAIIRVSGEYSKISLKNLTNSTIIKERTAIFSKIYDSNKEIIDEGIILFFPKGNSYTGEDTVEYYIHGSLFIINKILEELAKQENHFPAERGEFTKQALINGNLDLIQAEAVRDLIESETSLQQKQAIHQLNKQNSNKYLDIREELIKNLAFVETMIDFSEDYIEQNMVETIYQNIINLQKTIKNLISQTSRARKIREGINVAIIGAPNTGKSTLINYLTNQETSIVTSKQGTTRDIVEKYIDFFGYPVLISDTAGLRETEDEIEKIGIAKSMQKIEESDIKIFICDAENFESSYAKIAKYITENDILLINKIDLKKLQTNAKGIFISLTQNTNLNGFETALKEKLDGIFGQGLDYGAPNQLRHKQILEQVYSSLEQFLQIEQNDPVLMSFHLNTAINQMGELTGHYNVEEMLDKVFSTFCIGK